MQTNRITDKDVLVFDCDGVVLKSWGFREFLKKNYPGSIETVDFFFKTTFLDCLIGKADLKEVLPPLLKSIHWPYPLDHFIETWFELEHVPNSAIVSSIIELRDRGHRVFMATNQEFYRKSYLADSKILEPLFERMLVSCELKVAKPATEFFRAASEIINPKGRIYFWDDSLSNIQAANNVGWNSFLFTSENEFSNHLNCLFMK